MSKQHVGSLLVKKTERCGVLKIAGVIAEYNPFHNGHRYQIEQIKKELSDAPLVVAMSGNFLQRGEPACFDKWTRAGEALQNGADFSKTYALSKMIDNYYSYETDDDTEAIWNYVIAYLKEYKLSPEAETDAYIRGRLKDEEEYKSKIERLSLQPDYNTLAAKEGILAAADRHEHTLLRELIDNGVDVNYQDKFGRTALFFVVKEASDPEDHYDAKYLLDHGADADIKDHNGKKAFDSCSERTCWLNPNKK